MGTCSTIVGSVDSDVLAFTVGKDLVLDRVLAEADCIGSAGHVTMLSRMPVKPPLFSEAESRRVIAELVELIRQARAGRLRITVADQDIHLAVERRLTQRLGDLGRRIHTGRSRNDQVAVDLRLYAKEQLFGVMEEVLLLGEGLLRFGKRHALVPMVGRTHMQPAMPSSLGLWASAHTESLLADVSLLRAAYDLNDWSPLGSAAGYGVPLPVDRALTARLLGFRGACRSVLFAGNARGKVESVILSALAQVMLTLSRFSEDLVLYSMPETGYFVLPSEMCTGSSIMPQKRNPDVLELVRARAERVLASAGAAAAIVSRLPSGYNRDVQEGKELLIEGVDCVRGCLRILAALVGGLGIDLQALRAGFTSEVFATDRALERVGRGEAFRDAYEYVKTHLAELAQGDPDEAVAARFGAGRSCAPDFDALASDVKDAKRFVSTTRSS